MSLDRTFMRMALVQAHQAESAGEIPVGTVVVKDGQVIAVGRNAPISTHDPCAHAEIIALRAAAQTLGNYRLDGCTLYVTLEPCPMCAGAILQGRIQRLVFGATDPKTGAAGSVLNLFSNTQINHHTQVTGGVLSDDCAAILRNFFQKRRQEQAHDAQPLRDNALRTPDAAFQALPDYPFLPRFFSPEQVLQGWYMHYVDEGPADASHTVLCLHHLPGWSYRFRHLIPALTARGFRVLAPDLIGYGKSDKPKKADAHTPALYRDSLLHLLEAVQPSTLVLMGAGAGTHLAQHLYGQWSDVSPTVWQIDTEALASAESAPYPNQGYRAGPDTAPQLAQKLAQHTENQKDEASPDPAVEMLSGSADQMAELLAHRLLRR